MALETFSLLKSAVADWLNRQDLTAVIPTFISLTETNLNRTLRVRDMLTRADLTWDAEIVPLPVDFLELYSLEQTNPPAANVIPPLRYVGVDELKQIKAALPTGTARWFTIIGNNVELFPAPTADFDMTMIYYASITPLSDSETSNWLLTKSPDAYLYGSLLQAAPYLKNDERVVVWDAAYQRAISALTTESERAMRPTTSLVARKQNFGF